MFGKSKTPPSSNSSGSTSPSPTVSRKTTPSVISADMNIMGNIISDGVLDINGRIDGNVKCDSATIRDQGLIKGDVIADTVQVYGKIEGLVKARHVVLYATSHVTGIIMHESLSIEDGAFIDGKLKRTDKVFIEDESHFSSHEMDYDSEAAPKENVLDSLRLISG